MLASVTRIVPRIGSFEDALVAFRAASFQQCLLRLHGVASPAAELLRARTQLRIGDPNAALAALSNAQCESDRDSGETALLRAVAHSRLGAGSDADTCFRDAYVYGSSSMSSVLEAEVEFYKALTVFGAEDLSRARQLCNVSLELAFRPPLFDQPVGFVPLEHVVARTQELLGIVEAARGDYQALIGHTRSALSTLDSCAIPDIFQEAFLLRNLTILARDFDMAEDAAVLARRISTLAWTEVIC